MSFCIDQINKLCCMNVYLMSLLVLFLDLIFDAFFVLYNGRKATLFQKSLGNLYSIFIRHHETNFWFTSNTDKQTTGVFFLNYKFNLFSFSLMDDWFWGCHRTSFQNFWNWLRAHRRLEIFRAMKSQKCWPDLQMLLKSNLLW